MQFEKTEINAQIAKAMKEKWVSAPCDYVNDEHHGQRFIAWGESFLEFLDDLDMKDAYNMLKDFYGPVIALVSALGLMNLNLQQKETPKTMSRGFGAARKAPSRLPEWA